MALSLISGAVADSTGEIDLFQKRAAREHGELGQRAAAFLVAHMPETDRTTLTADFLMENLRLALEARERFPWAKALPEERFFNDVLPYAVLDETRERWRADMLTKAGELVASCTTAQEAAQTINQRLFKLVNVHYNTGRKRPNQSPSESIAQGRATCTGLAVLLVDACRAVGVPARVAGVAEWSHKPGNHTWVEIWDGEWKFTGADEYDPAGLNRGWFVEDASKAQQADPLHAVWASSWQRGDGHFPMIWDLQDHSVGAVNVTARYATKPTRTGEGVALVHLRVLGPPNPGGDARIVVAAELLDKAGRVVAEQQTKAGTADLNDMPTFEVAPGEYRWRLRQGDAVSEMPLTVDSAGERTVELQWNPGESTRQGSSGARPAKVD